MMKCLLIQCLLWSLFIVLQWGSHECCLKDERMALLQIKAFFKVNASADVAHHILPSWLEKGDDSDCCTWERVVCNSITGRVTELTLDYLRSEPLSYYVDTTISLNVSLFDPFKELVNLQLSGNGFNGFLLDQGFDKLKLETLDLAHNYFDNIIILRSLSVVTTLRSLNLSDNWISGTFVLQELSNLTNLEILDLSRNELTDSLTTQDQKSLLKLNKLQHLDLGYNSFNIGILKSLCNLVALTFLSLESNGIEGTLSNDIDMRSLKNLEFLILRSNGLNGTIPVEAFTSLKNLKVLDLSGNDFTGSIPTTIAFSSNLIALSLARNNLTGTLPSPEFCKLKNLEELDLSFNNLEGALPPCFYNLSSLKLLDLSSNQFKGEIAFIFPNLKSLEYIRLGNNNFDGEISFSLLANHSKAKIVEILNNGNLEIETEGSNWIPKFQLEVLVLSGCNLNKQSGKIPSFIAYQSMLKELDISNNNLRGDFPDWIIENNSELKFLNLRNNFLEGKLYLQPHINASLLWMDVSENELNGQLQENVGRMLPQMMILNLSGNYFEGVVPSSFCNMSVLDKLDLSRNYFNGEFSKEIVSGCHDQLSVLMISDNRFHGEIFSTRFNMTGLIYLYLENNRFSGSFPNSITRSYHLNILDASNNQFSGELGHWISNMTNLMAIIIRNNSLQGQLPCKISRLFLLDISHNSLSGILPTCPFELEHVLIQSNKFTGSIPETLLNSSYIKTLDIRDNDLSGNLPSLIGAENMRVLLLGGNRLNGSIPNQFCKLQILNLLDLSNNHLSGQIPRCMGNITFGKLQFPESFVFGWGYIPTSFIPMATYGNFFVKDYLVETPDDDGLLEVKINFVTKRMFNSYKGDILKYMSGLDLSCNEFTGEIPYEVGNLHWIHALNLSHNRIEGLIPTTFSGMKQLESLDLSYNNLTGKIPSVLTYLNFLEVFSVAHNNLSGRTPEMKGQFATFDQSSYQGNPYLCGAPLAYNCSHTSELPSSPTKTTELTTKTKWYEVDMLVLWIAFVVAYIIFFLGVVISLYVNHSWRRRLFNFLDDCYYWCYYKFCM